MHVTLGEAARQSGISKSTLSRAIKDGKLSAVRSADTGSYKIEQSELARYLEATAVIRATVEKPAENGPVTQSATPAERHETAALEAQIAGLKQVAELLREQLDDMKGQCDHERQRADRGEERADQLTTELGRLTERLALPAPKPEPAAEPEPELSRLRRAWRWMQATGCLAGVGLLLALMSGGAGAQPQQTPQRQCFTVVMNHSTTGGSLGAILIDQCTGNTWQLIRVTLPGG